MFKTTLTVLALTLSALAAQAGTDLTQNAVALGIVNPMLQDVTYYCEWGYVFDGWGNYVYAWQCY